MYLKISIIQFLSFSTMNMYYFNQEKAHCFQIGKLGSGQNGEDMAASRVLVATGH